MVDTFHLLNQQGVKSLSRSYGSSISSSSLHSEKWQTPRSCLKRISAREGRHCDTGTGLNIPSPIRFPTLDHPRFNFLLTRPIISLDRRDQADWSRALADRRFNDGVALNTWQVVLPRKSEPAVRKFVQELSRIGNSVGMTVRQPEFHVLEQTGTFTEDEIVLPSRPQHLLFTRGVRACAQCDPPHTTPFPLICSAGRDFITQIRAITDTQMVMCVLPDDKKDRYDAIKQLLCCQRPVPSQLVLSKTCGRVI